MKKRRGFAGFVALLPRGEVMRSVWWASLVFVLFVSAAPPPTEVLLSGTVALSREGDELGAETFQLLGTEWGYLLISEGRVSTQEGQIGWRAVLRLSGEWRPHEYEIIKQVAGQVSVFRAAWVTEHPGWVELTGYRNGERLFSTSLTGKNWLVLDRDVISHYLILSLVLHLSDVRGFTALVPQARAVAPLSASASGLAAFSAPWGQAVARRWRLSLGGAEVFLYEHAGEFLWAEVPGESLSAWRSDLFPELPRPYRVQHEMTLPPGAREEEVRFASGAVELSGTFLLPAGEGPFPAVLFIPGTGQVNRDGSAPGKPAAIFRELAYSLVQERFASLRYDKRGVGESDGDLSLASMSDLRSDAGKALSWLISRPEVYSVFVVGHSEGALHALALAEEAGVAGLVLLGAPARPLGEVLVWQLESALRAAGAPEEMIARQLERLQEFFVFVQSSSGDWGDYAPEELLAALPGYLAQDLEELRKTSLRWWREALSFDPVAAVREVGVPLLAVSGGTDIRVPPEDVLRLAEAAREAGNPDARGIVIPEMNHWLRFQPGRPLPERLTGPLDPRAIQTILDWLYGHSRR